MTAQSQAGGEAAEPGGEALVHRVRPAAGRPAGALVLLHGRGADEHDLFAARQRPDPVCR